jgi:hypothetical protein
LLRELGVNAANKSAAKKNEILSRHGKPLLAVKSTVFDNWITPNGSVRLAAVSYLVESCGCVAFWSFADWGLYARLVSVTIEGAVAPILKVGQILRIPVKQVFSEGELPSW